MKNSVFALMLLAAAGAVAPAVAAGEPTADQTRGVDFRGAPPFDRHALQSDRANPVVAGRSVRSTGVAVRGRPPFKRSLDAEAPTDNVVFARLEEATEAPRRVRRRGPPGKRAPFVTR